jgi:hypothetical protein
MPFRKKKGDKFVGNYVVRIKGREINLATKDAALAIDRAREAKAGKRDFGVGAAAAKVVADAFTGEPASTSPPASDALAPTSSGTSPHADSPPAPGFDPSASAPATAPPGGAKGDYIPPPPNWASDVGAAAGAAGAAEEAPPTPEDAAEEAAMLEELLGTAADAAVELQIGLQAWIIAKRANAHAGEVPEDAKGRIVGRRLWLKCFQKLVPVDLGIPEWLAAPIMVASLTMPVQIRGATPMPPKKPKPGDAPEPSRPMHTVPSEPTPEASSPAA